MTAREHTDDAAQPSGDGAGAAGAAVFVPVSDGPAAECGTGTAGERRDCRTLRRHCGPGGAGAAVSDSEEYDRQDGGHGAAAYGSAFGQADGGVCGGVGVRHLCGAAQCVSGGESGGADPVLQLFCRLTGQHGDGVPAAFEQYRVETEGYIRTGIVCYDGAVPQYGVAVGQNLTCREVDGETVVEQNDFRATFTASKLSFWQDASEVAYVSNNRLYITNITVLEGMSIGEWEISSENGLVIRWMGG